MTARKVPVPKKGISAVAIADVIAGIRKLAECVHDIEKERTQQISLRENARVGVERIHAMRDVLLNYLEHSFDERKETFRLLFDHLDQALERDNVQMAAAVLDSVVKLADTSPFKALRDVASAREALGEKGKEWKF